jgi:hypothetical protein
VPVFTPNNFAVKKWLNSCANIPGRNTNENKTTTIFILLVMKNKRR